jgi:uncharacterized membrane protein YebE (DUF533 family)
MARRTKEITMSRLKSALVAAIGTVAIAGFANALAGQAAMAAQRTVPAGSIRFLHDPIPLSVSQGSSLSARQKRQGIGMVLPAVQRLRCPHWC